MEALPTSIANRSHTACGFPEGKVADGHMSPTSGAKWQSQWVFAAPPPSKPHKGKRVCMNPKDLNEVTLTYAEPVPDLQQSLDAVGKIKEIRCVGPACRVPPDTD